MKEKEKKLKKNLKKSPEVVADFGEDFGSLTKIDISTKVTEENFQEKVKELRDLIETLQADKT